MKKIVFTILVCGIIVLELTGCNNLKQKQKDDIHSFVGTIIKCEEKSMIVRPNENEEEYNSSDKFRIKYIDGFDSCKINDKVKITYKGMINASYPAQVGTTNIEINDFDFYITKLESYNDIRFNDYYTTDNRTIYLAGNIGEFYIKEQDTDITLKTYLSTAFETVDDGIKHITNKLELKKILKDGGTRIYKSKDKNVTMIICNTIKNDKSILIGDYSMEYVEGDCKN